MLEIMWRWFKEFSDDTMQKFDNQRKLILLLAICTGAGFSAGIVSQKYIVAPFVQQAASFPIAAADSDLQVCDALSQLTHVQAAYDARIQPIQQRWIELTASLERSDLLPYERDKLLETADLVQQEMERTQAEHGKIVDGITQLCKQN